jgi:hypothetical protein
MAFETYTPLAVYPADGVQTSFPIPDKFYDVEDVHVFLISAAGVEFEIDQGTDFSVSVIMQDASPPGRKTGNANLVLAPADGVDVVVMILPPTDQDQKFEGRPVTPRMVERVHDRHSMRHAALLEFFYRGYRSPLNAPPGLRFIQAGRTGYVPTWDADGNLIEGPTVGQVNVVAEAIDEVNTVAAIAPAVVATALIDDEIVIAANNMPAIVAAPGAANDAAASALLAQRFATYPEDTDIPGQGGLRSALHWAAKAAASAATAAANIIGAIMGWPTQSPPNDADFFSFIRNSDGAGRRITWANIKAQIRPRFWYGTLLTPASTSSATWVDTGLQVTAQALNVFSAMKVEAHLNGIGGTASTHNLQFRLVRDATVISALGAAAGSRTRASAEIVGSNAVGGAAQMNTVLVGMDQPGDTNPHVYKVQWQISGGTGFLNRSLNDTDGASYSRLASTITVSEGVLLS